MFLPFAADGLNAAVATWQARPPGGEALLMFVPIAVLDAAQADPEQTICLLRVDGARSPQAVVDALSDDRFVRAWIGFQLDPKRTKFAGQLKSALHRHGGLRIDPRTPIHRSSAEQSNTSIRIGEQAILKFIRKLESGEHPEVEIGRYLADCGYAATPPFIGSVEIAGDDPQARSALSVLQQFVPNDGDGWSWTLQQLSEGLSLPTNSFEPLNRWIQSLGTRTAEMHRAFAANAVDAAFRPEPVSAHDIHEWESAALGMATRAIDGIQHHGARDEQARQLLALRDTVRQRLHDIQNIRPDFCKTRHHGDFHLGQTLVAGGDAIILDFEGEPLRPLALRRAKHCVLRDVAGIIRSFSYAAEAAARAIAIELPQTDRRRRLARLEAWREEASRSFVDSYFSAAEGLKSIPQERSDAERVLNFFLLEKALYEVAYELANRPDWLAIPVHGVMSLLRVPQTRRRHSMPFGAELYESGVRFRLWGPSHQQISLELDGATKLIPMRRQDDGWYELVAHGAGPGRRYRFVLPDGTRVPDPASRYQPEDVHGPSEVIDPCSYAWSDADWRGRPWTDAILYELHIGAFTDEGTFHGVEKRLDYLRALGITGIELMPIGEFPGQRNWGYDGVLPFAPDASYGRPDDLKRLIDAAHARGMMVLLDVVYNHFGPEGDYSRVIAPEMFTDRHKTPWGEAINLHGPSGAPVREFFIENALYWLEEFHLDGLRLDAAHALHDESPHHFLEQLAERVRQSVHGRHVHLVLENEENHAWRLTRGDNGEPRWFTAQWNDDVHHVLHVAATGENNGYYADYQCDTVKLARALAEGFAFQGELMPYRGRARGEPSAGLPPTAFIAFIQNHDQVGNRAFGERLNRIASRDAVRAVAAIYLLLPQIPMLFMGEEWGATQPFPFFCDFAPKLAGAVRKGRRAEFARFPEFQDPARREQIPDPVAEETFRSAKLRWQEMAQDPHAGWLDWYRRIIAVRQSEIAPRLKGIHHGGGFEIIGPGAVTVRWACEDESLLVLRVNVSGAEVQFPQAPGGRLIWLEGEQGDSGAAGPYSVRWSIYAPGTRGGADAGR